MNQTINRMPATKITADDVRGMMTQVDDLGGQVQTLGRLVAVKKETAGPTRISLATPVMDGIGFGIGLIIAPAVLTLIGCLVWVAVVAVTRM